MPAEKIDICVVTTADDLNDSFILSQPLNVVFNRALQLVGGGGQRDQFTIEYQDQPLELTKKISDYVAQFGWENGVCLDLVPRPEVIAGG